MANNVDKITEQLNQTLRQLRVNIREDKATRDSVMSLSRQVKLNFTKGARARLKNVVDLMLPKLSVDEKPQYSKREIENRLMNLLIDYVKGSRKIKEEKVKEIIVNLKSEIRIERNYFFPLSDVWYENKRIPFTEDSFFISSAELRNQFDKLQDLPNETLSPYLQKKHMLLGVKAKGPRNDVTLQTATERAEVLVSLIDSGFLNEFCKVSTFDNAEEAPEKGNDEELEISKVLEIDEDSIYFRTKANLSRIALSLNDRVEYLQTERRFMFNPETDMQKRMVSAMEWLGKSAIDEVTSRQFLQAMISIEALLENPNNGSSITDQVSDAVSFILGVNAEERQELNQFVRKMYKKRSRLVHDGTGQIARSSFVRVFGMVDQLINHLCNDEELKTITTIKGLSEWLQNKRLS